MFVGLKKQCIFALALLHSNCVLFIENIEIDSVKIMFTLFESSKIILSSIPNQNQVVKFI